jgi:hypothetical protein
MDQRGGNGKGTAESVLDDVATVPDHVTPSLARAFLVGVIWVILWSASCSTWPSGSACT